MENSIVSHCEYVILRKTSLSRFQTETYDHIKTDIMTHELLHTFREITEEDWGYTIQPNISAAGELWGALHSLSWVDFLEVWNIHIPRFFKAPPVAFFKSAVRLEKQAYKQIQVNKSVINIEQSELLITWWSKLYSTYMKDIQIVLTNHLGDIFNFTITNDCF